MPITVNGTTITNVVCNGTNVNTVVVNGVTVWTRELIIFNNGITRSGDAFNGIILGHNSAYDETYSATYTSGKLNASASVVNHDRGMFCGGMLKLPIDITNFSKMHVSFTSSVSNTSTASVEFGLAKTLLSGTSYSNYLQFQTNAYTNTIPRKSTVTTASYSSTTTLTLDLSAYKSAYGNSGYFTYFANKLGTGNAGSSSISISKIWFT